MKLAFLAVIIAAVFLPGPAHFRAGSCWPRPRPRPILTTSAEVHDANQFSFRPIVEVAVLFFGIFATMMPMLDRLLNVGGNSDAGPGLLGGRDALRFSGQRAGLPGVFQRRYRAAIAASDNGFAAAGAAAKIVALSVGTVVFGALTYIGNGPNLMVKSIADHRESALARFSRLLV